VTVSENVSKWIDRYVVAWNSNDAEDIGQLFTEDATYYTEPFNKPWRGRGQIVEQWLLIKDEPGETTFEWEPVALTDEVSIIQGVTTYPDKTFSNLWLIRLDDEGRCREFTEWWMTQHDSTE
jgi:uncharacterized protein (TIGR02246 family)